MKKFLFLLIIILPSFLMAQVGPFTNNALSAASGETVDSKTLEMQFAPEYYVSTNEFDGDGKSVSLDEGILETGISLQFNAGITEKLEWGIGLPIDASELSVGLKYNLVNKNEKFFVALATWTDISTESRTWLINGTQYADNMALAGYGVIFQYGIHEKANIYLDIYGQNYLQTTLLEHKINMYFNFDIDYEIVEGIRAALGFAYENNNFKNTDFNSSLGNSSYGFFFEKWDNWSLYYAHYIDIFGKNNNSGNTFTFNITRSF